jgi:hypothetical protein
VKHAERKERGSDSRRGFGRRMIPLSAESERLFEMKRSYAKPSQTALSDLLTMVPSRKRVCDALKRKEI